MPERPRPRLSRRNLALAAAAAAGILSCRGPRPDPHAESLDAAARAYVRLVLALGDRDSDSLDNFWGPDAWQAEVRAEHPTLAQIRSEAAALAGTLRGRSAPGAREDDERRAFLVAQLQAVVSRIDILGGARPRFDEEARLLFGISTHDAASEPRAGVNDPTSRGMIAAVHAELNRLLPGQGALAARYADFERRVLVPAERLPTVIARGVDGCRAATREHVTLPAGEHVDVVYTRDLAWSALTRYEGGYVSRVTVNASLPVTVDAVLDLACHEAYPGHHTIGVLLESRFGRRRPELLVQPTFSPQSALQEAAASLAPSLAFTDAARTTFERDVLFPAAGLDPSDAARHVAVARLVDRLHPVVVDIVRQYLDGALDFPRAAAALEGDALMPAPEATLKFVNQFRSYAATYTIARDRLAAIVGGRWDAYVAAVTDPAQTVPPTSRMPVR